MASRVGGGGYAESRGGGVGDGTGGGMSANGRDGLGGSGKGGDSNLAAERQRLRAMGATTITPKYGWDQARLSDFGITGGLMNAFNGLYAGNTYEGRTPQGLRGGYARDGGPKWTQMGGLYGGGAAAGGLLPMPTPQPAPAMGLQFKPQMFQPGPVTIPGGMDYAMQFDPWKYFS